MKYRIVPSVTWHDQEPSWELQRNSLPGWLGWMFPEGMRWTKVAGSKSKPDMEYLLCHLEGRPYEPR